MITIEHLTYQYPQAASPALHDVSLQIPAGEFVLLAGPSGAGKSTLLRALNGLVPHFSGGQISGRIAVNNHDPLRAGPAPFSRIVGFVFQNPEAQSVLDTVEAEIAFALENAAIPPAEMRLRVEEVLSLLELTPVRDRPVRTLSGGERQRLAIATVLALRPHVLALDEPTSQLDPKSSSDLLHALVRLNEELGLTIILAEHRLERVVRFAERVVYLQEGRVLLDGPMAELLPAMPQLPPVAELGREMKWQPLPVTVKAARRLVSASPGVSPANGHVAPRGQPYLQAQNVHYAYRDQPVLRGVNVQVHPGEAVVLMGRNGSGKTTLLKCLVGLLTPTKGEVSIAGRMNAGRTVADICRDAAYLPQNPDDLLFSDTVAMELAATLRNHHRPDGQMDIAGMLAELDLVAQAGAYPRDLSVGQRQRVALGAVMISRPGLLLLDEPTRGLDRAAKRMLIALWKKWQAQGMGLLLVTHDVELAAQIADRVLILSSGEKIADGPAGQILSASPLFAPQIARLFPGRGWLTVSDALAGLRAQDNEPQKGEHYAQID